MFYHVFRSKDDMNNNELGIIEDTEIKKEDKESMDKRTNGTLEATGLLGEGFVDETLYVEGLSPEELARSITTIKKEVEMAETR